MQVTLFDRDLFWGGILILSVIAYVHGLFKNQKEHFQHKIDMLELEKKQVKKEKEDVKEELEKKEKPKKRDK